MMKIIIIVIIHQITLSKETDMIIKRIVDRILPLFQRYIIIISGTYDMSILHGKGDFADVTKQRLRDGELSWIICVGPV